MRQRVVVASNRGPVAHVVEEGRVIQRRGVGGLVTAVTAAVRGRDARWIVAAITPADRDRAGDEPVRLEGQDDLLVRFIAPDEQTYDRYYNGFANRILWFLSHDLWEEPPTFGEAEAAMWHAYREVNAMFATAMADERGDTRALLCPQDYHLALVPGLLRARGLQHIGLFWHIPFCTPEQLEILPKEWALDLLRGLLGADLVGFHVERWASRFRACCEDLLGARIHGEVVELDGRRTTVRAFPIGVDADDLRAHAQSPRVADLLEQIERRAGNRTLLLRVDRTEPSKNILRGLEAFELLLERRPDLRARVLHLALLTPSRGGIPEYQEYMALCTAQAERIAERFGSNGASPIEVVIADDFDETLAAYRRYDVLFVNTLADGMNLVAREGPVLNERAGVLVLSRNAGAADELGDAPLSIDPFDVEQTAAALEAAIDMGNEERRARAARLAERAAGTSPPEWLEAQLSTLAGIESR